MQRGPGHRDRGEGPEGLKRASTLGLAAALWLAAGIATAQPRRLAQADTDRGAALGGGLDFGLSGRWSARALFHLRLLSGEGGWDSDPRLAVGVSYRLGR